MGKAIAYGATSIQQQAIRSNEADTVLREPRKTPKSFLSIQLEITFASFGLIIFESILPTLGDEITVFGMVPLT